ncbi:MAG: metal-dependent hydrolase [Lysobacterales bacterium]
MDSVTQILLGASVAAACVPAVQRRRALGYGAVLGTLPDLDVLWRFSDPVAAFTYHRSASHSLLLLPWLALLLWWLVRRLDPALSVAPRRWLLAFLLALVTHPLLDALTIYGTQLWWPLDPTPVGLGSVFIIDPLYSLPLLLAVCWLARAPQGRASTRVLVSALAWSSAYLMWGWLAQQWVLQRARSELANGPHAQAPLLATPSPFNSVLWRVVLRYPGGYAEAYDSLLADTAAGPWRYFDSADSLIDPLEQHWPVQRLRWFTHGWYAVDERNEELVLSDLRMGSEPTYVFRFAVAERDGLAWQPMPARQLPTERPPMRVLSWLGERAWQGGQCLPTPDQLLATPSDGASPAGLACGDD